MKTLFFILLLSCKFVYATPPIKLIIPFSAGGYTDNITRQIQIDLSRELNRLVVIEYKLGAGGDVAANYIVNSPSTEIVLMLQSVGLVLNLVTGAPAFDQNKIHHIITLGTSPLILVASKKLKVNTLKEFTGLSNTRIAYGSAGIGTGSHLAGAILKQSTRQNLIHIPYKGLSAAVTDVIGEHIDIVFAFAPTVLPYIQNNQLIPLAVGGASRLNDLPNIPTFRESKFYDAEYSHWFALFSNKNYGDPEIRAIVKAYKKILTNKTTSLPYRNAGLIIDDPLNINDINFISNQKTHYKNLLENINLQ